MRESAMAGRDHRDVPWLRAVREDAGGVNAARERPRVTDGRSEAGLAVPARGCGKSASMNIETAGSVHCRTIAGAESGVSAVTLNIPQQVVLWIGPSPKCFP